ncbi:hypothetical protein WN55_07098 [Dufourea novaeangliae]|uniref:Uncharacterized protein n=1 Tax=Dufourea novaeangliae TaxID=178035 RepID=A0A154PS79_DUFNO|nr:hypothetical protein WN55_07098 [Dufourea novaeangliae]
MRRKEHAEILSVIEQETIELFDKDREILRNTAKENILKIQEENKRYHDHKSKPATVYKEGDIAVIKRTQFGAGLKIQKKFLGPYVVSQAKGNDRYEVIKLGDGEGQKITTTSADHMKLYKA